MRKYLIEDKKYYKANTHSHSTHSDGKFSLEENIKAYKEKGYDIYAVTDHCYTENFHEKFTTEDFVVINGYENVIWEGKKFVEDDNLRGKLRVYHFNFFAKDPNKLKTVGITKDGFYRFFVKVKHPENKPYELAGGKFAKLKYSVKSVNKMLKRANEEGWLVQLNHPVWSLNEPKDYLGLKGLWGLEIYNTDCNGLGYDEENGYVYDLMLRDGQEICVTADDDNHKLTDRFGGFTMIGANALNYQEVIAAMERKDLYCSTGPTIDYIYYEDGKFFIKCSPVVKVTMTSGSRNAVGKISEDGAFTTAVFNDFIGIDDFKYYRFEFTDEHGNKAFTRAYFRKEIK